MIFFLKKRHHTVRSNHGHTTRSIEIKKRNRSLLFLKALTRIQVLETQLWNKQELNLQDQKDSTYSGE